jgi:acetoin utilization protein AcuB
MRVSDLMTRPLVTVGHDATVADAWSIMRTRQVRHLPVLDADRRLIGILTDHDLRQVILERYVQEEPSELARSLARLRVNEIMTWAVITVSGDAEIRHAARIMHEHKLGALPVADGGRVVGMLTATDVIRAATEGQ